MTLKEMVLYLTHVIIQSDDCFLSNPRPIKFIFSELLIFMAYFITFKAL